MWIYSERRCKWRSQHFSGGARRSCLWRDGAVRPPVEAGTHRNDSGDSLNVAGIHVLQGVEDVKLALYVLAFLDRSNIGFAKQTYQIDTGLSNEAYALGAGIFFVVYAFLGVPANLLMRKLGARTWIGTTTLLWGFLSAAMAWADTEAKFLIVRTLLGAAEAGFFPGMIYLTSQWFPQRNRASIMGLFYMGAPLALTLGSPLSGALLEMH